MGAIGAYRCVVQLLAQCRYVMTDEGLHVGATTTGPFKVQQAIC